MYIWTEKQIYLNLVQIDSIEFRHVYQFLVYFK